MIRILLAQGHGGGKAHNRGGLYYHEGDNNYLFSLVLKEELEKYDGVQIDLLRKVIADNPSLEERAKAGKGYDLYYSIHSNGFYDTTVNGTEVFDSIEKPNKELAKNICDITSNFFKHNNRGVKYREGQPNWNWYGELRLNGAKSGMIVENGFHTNSADCLIFKNSHKTLAELQAYVIAEHYNLNKKVTDFPLWKTKMLQEWEKAITLGITDGTNPNGTPTRIQVISMIMRATKENNNG